MKGQGTSVYVNLVSLKFVYLQNDLCATFHLEQGLQASLQLKSQLKYNAVKSKNAEQKQSGAL